MNQLTKQTSAIQTILSSPRAIEANADELKYVLTQAMAKAFAYMGAKTTDKQADITYMVQNMPAEVVANLPAIRLSEIPVAINRGVLGQFGEFYGLNIATFMRFLISHYQSEQRLQAVKTHLATNATIQNQTTAPTEAEMQTTRLNRIATAFEQYKTRGHYDDHGSLVFDNINKLGKIPFSPARETQILEQARLNLIERYSRVSNYPDQRATLRATLNNILNGDAPNLIITEAKRIALFELFDGLIEKGMGVLDWMGWGCF